jgi:hypothetical protein
MDQLLSHPDWQKACPWNLSFLLVCLTILRPYIEGAANHTTTERTMV